METALMEICRLLKAFGSAPTLEEMPRRTLKQKGIHGPTAAHVIEEIHVPLNLAYVTFTTGTSAFQTPVGITHEEMPCRMTAGKKALQYAGLKAGDSVLVTYPPLINVFTEEAFRQCKISHAFLLRSSRDAFLAALYETKPQAILGESSFLRAALEDARSLGVAKDLPPVPTLITAGTPLDLDLLSLAREILQAKVHDLYGCQEFGCLTLNGIPLREDIVLLPSQSNSAWQNVFVGGLPTGDCFPIAREGHICDAHGKILTYRRKRTDFALEIIVHASPLASLLTLQRVAKTILRLKSRIVKIAPDVVMHASQTVLEAISGSVSYGFMHGPTQTLFFDDLAQAQISYQQNGKRDPLWLKVN